MTKKEYRLRGGLFEEWDPGMSLYFKEDDSPERECWRHKAESWVSSGMGRAGGGGGGGLT